MTGEQKKSRTKPIEEVPDLLSDWMTPISKNIYCYLSSQMSMLPNIREQYMITDLADLF